MKSKLFVTPRIYLASAPEMCRGSLKQFLQETVGADADACIQSGEADGQLLPEVAGRLCYLSFGRPRPAAAGKTLNETYLAHILESGHGSVLEHSTWGFIFAGVSRSFSHELVRHRAGFGFSQLSQRYVDSSQVKFVCPPAIRNCPELVETLEQLCENARAAYAGLTEELFEQAVKRESCGAADDPRKVREWVAACKDQELKTSLRKEARQAARAVLPNCAETMIYATANARAWRHFIEMRCSKHADAEMREVAGLVLERLQKEAPGLFGDYRLERLADGSSHASTPWRKV